MRIKAIRHQCRAISGFSPEAWVRTTSLRSRPQLRGLEIARHQASQRHVELDCSFWSKRKVGATEGSSAALISATGGSSSNHMGQSNAHLAIRKQRIEDRLGEALRHRGPSEDSTDQRWWRSCFARGTSSHEKRDAGHLEPDAREATQHRMWHREGCLFRLHFSGSFGRPTT